MGLLSALEGFISRFFDSVAQTSRPTTQIPY
jgi:hypothetical protein